MRVVNLASGSKGNVTFFEAGGVRILIDVGLSLREIQRRLELVNEKLENIDAVLITHEHSDHIKGFLQLMKTSKVIAYAPKTTVIDFLKISDEKILDRISLIGNHDINIGEIQITPFPLPHDSMECYGFLICYKNKRVGIATDLGYVPANMLEILEGADVVYIESNHDRNMLLSNMYPRFVKQRILSDKGHLSNEQSASAIVSLVKKGTKHFVLSHISEHSNTISLAYLASARALEKAGFTLEKDVFLRYSRQDMPGNNYIIGEDNEE